MRKIFSCIIVILVVAIVWVDYATESDSSVIENQTESLPSEITPHYIDSYTSNFELNSLCQSSGASNILQTNNTVKRPNIRCKNCIEFVKAGKVINVCCSNFIQREALKNSRCFVKSSSWLIRLGKLII